MLDLSHLVVPGGAGIGKVDLSWVFSVAGLQWAALCWMNMMKQGQMFQDVSAVSGFVSRAGVVDLQGRSGSSMQLRIAARVPGDLARQRICGSRSKLCVPGVSGLVDGGKVETQQWASGDITQLRAADHIPEHP